MCDKHRITEMAALMRSLPQPVAASRGHPARWSPATQTPTQGRTLFNYLTLGLERSLSTGVSAWLDVLQRRPRGAAAPRQHPRRHRNRQPRVPWSGSSRGTCGLVSPGCSPTTAQNSTSPESWHCPSQGHAAAKARPYSCQTRTVLLPNRDCTPAKLGSHSGQADKTCDAKTSL